jgi:phosphatidate cytidylyltransferase
MREPRQVAVPSLRNHVLVALALGGAALAALLSGRPAVSAFVAVLLVVAYADLRALLAPRGHLLTFALGGAGVAAFLWSGYTGKLQLLPVFAACLVLALLVSRIALNEVGARASGVIGDLAATLAAAGIVGVTGAHLLLLRAVTRVGFRGLLALGLTVVANDASAFFVGRAWGRHPLNRLVSPNKTWEGAGAGFIASVVVGLIVGLTLDPPFGVRSGLAFGLGIGVLAPLGDLAVSAIKRSAGVKHSGSYLGSAGGALDVADSFLLAAPAFYWAFRTIAL